MVLHRKAYDYTIRKRSEANSSNRGCTSAQHRLYALFYQWHHSCRLYQLPVEYMEDPILDGVVVDPITTVGSWRRRDYKRKRYIAS
jgi:hypothetical protein